MPPITLEEFYTLVLKRYQSAGGYLTPAKANLLTLEIIDMFSDRPSDRAVLKYLARFLTIDSYVSLVDERTINHLCGYPMCSLAPERNNQNNPLRTLSNTMQQYNDTNPLHHHNGESQRKASLTPFSYLNNYCSKRHYQCSKFYKSQLKNDALFSRQDLFLTNEGEVIAPCNFIAHATSIGTRTRKYDVILLEEVWDHQAKHNQLSLVDVLNDLNIGHATHTEGSDKENKENKIVPDELMKDVIVEKFPSNRAIQEFDEDQLAFSIEERAKQIDGYVTEL